MRRKSDVLTTLFFFVIVVSLFPLGIGPEMAMLRQIAPGVLWVAALLATMLSLNRLFAADHADGTLEQMALVRRAARRAGDGQGRSPTGCSPACRWRCWRRCWACSSTCRRGRWR